jgi:hypothetical protein
MNDSAITPVATQLPTFFSEEVADHFVHEAHFPDAFEFSRQRPESY